MTTGAAEQLATEADRGRAALLAAVSHDLRAPLAAAKAAVSGLRSCDARLTPGDRAEPLDAAERSLDLLGSITASLLDVSRLQAGALAVFPRPSDLDEIVTDSLAALGPRARTVLADIPAGLPAIMADPAIMERIIANLVGNALRYAPAGSPPLVTAQPRRGDRCRAWAGGLQGSGGGDGRHGGTSGDSGRRTDHGRVTAKLAVGRLRMARYGDCALARQSSLVMTWRAPAAGMASRAPTKLPKKPPTQSPIEVPIRSESRTSSGLTLAVRLMITGFSTWFSISW
jgi:hypothetical protein